VRAHRTRVQFQIYNLILRQWPADQLAARGGNQCVPAGYARFFEPALRPLPSSLSKTCGPGLRSSPDSWRTLDLERLRSFSLISLCLLLSSPSLRPLPTGEFCSSGAVASDLPPSGARGSCFAIMIASACKLRRRGRRYATTIHVLVSGITKVRRIEGNMIEYQPQAFL
jgi:hypothetical protein